MYPIFYLLKGDYNLRLRYAKQTGVCLAESEDFGGFRVTRLHPSAWSQKRVLRERKDSRFRVWI